MSPPPKGELLEAKRSPAAETTPPPPVAMSAEAAATAAKLATSSSAAAAAAVGVAAADADAEGAAYGAVLPQTGAVAGTAANCWRLVQQDELISLVRLTALHAKFNYSCTTLQCKNATLNGSRVLNPIPGVTTTPPPAKWPHPPLPSAGADAGGPSWRS